MNQINVNEINQIKDAYIIDVREPYEFAKSHIKGAVNIPFNTFKNNPAEYLKSEQMNYFVCLSGKRSTMAADAATNAGFANVTVLLGGMVGYFGNL